MEKKKIQRAKRAMRNLPNDTDKIEEFLGSHPNLAKLLCEFLECNDKVLPSRIIGWKQFKNPKRKDTPTQCEG